MILHSHRMYEMMLKRLRRHMDEHPDEPLFVEYPDHPCREFTARMYRGSILITHPVLQGVLLGTHPEAPEFDHGPHCDCTRCE
jgi:hypothetical protein